MPETKNKGAARPPEKVSLALPPVYQGNGSYTESPRGARDVQFAMPGSQPKPVEVLQVDSTALPQPFLDATVFKKWQNKS